MDMNLPNELFEADPKLAAGAAAGAVAWLIEYRPGFRAALAPYATLELLDQPTLVKVPGAAYYCDTLAAWQGQWLAVLDLHVLLEGYRAGNAPPLRHLLVLAYQIAPGQALHHAALSLPALPLNVTVQDRMQCALPGGNDLWPALASACFEHEGQPVPVLDTARLFSTYHG